MKRRILAAFALGLFAGAGYASTDVVQSTAVAPPAALVAQADAAYAKRDDLTQAKIALVYYQKASAADPSALEPCWKAARVAWWIGDHSEMRADKLAYFQQGIDYAKKGLANHPDSVEAHFWLGGNYGSYGEARGILKSLFLIKPIRREMAEVIRLNDRYDGGGGYRVLGALDFKVPGFGGGSKKRAFEELSKSLAMDPQNPFTRYYLADYYLSVDDKGKAREELHALQTLAPEPNLEPELRMMQKKGLKLAEKL